MCQTSPPSIFGKENENPLSPSDTAQLLSGLEHTACENLTTISKAIETNLAKIR